MDRHKVQSIKALIGDNPRHIDLIVVDPDNCNKCQFCQPFLDVFQCEESGALFNRETLRTHSCMGFKLNRFLEVGKK